MDVLKNKWSDIAGVVRVFIAACVSSMVILGIVVASGAAGKDV